MTRFLNLAEHQLRQWLAVSFAFMILPDLRPAMVLSDISHQELPPHFGTFYVGFAQKSGHPKWS